MKVRGFWPKIIAQNQLGIYFLTVSEYCLVHIKTHVKLAHALSFSVNNCFAQNKCTVTIGGNLQSLL